MKKLIIFLVILCITMFAFATEKYGLSDGQLHVQQQIADAFENSAVAFLFLELASVEADTLAGEYVTADTLIADSISVRVINTDSLIAGLAHGDTLIFEYAEIDTAIVDTINVRAINITEKITSAISEPTALYTPYTNIYWVDAGGGGDYATIQEAIDVVDALAFLNSKCIINIAPGTYTENLTFTNEKYIKINMAGVKIDGNVTFTTTQQGGDYYSKIEFCGGMSNRAEKGDNAEIAGDITGTRNNDSLIYLSFTGMELSGNMAFTVDGTWVVFLNHTYFSNSSAFISGDFTDVDSAVLLETMGKSCIKAHIAKPSDGTATSVSLYDVSETEFDLINITPIFDGLIRNCTFTSDVTITSNTFKIDNFSYKEIVDQAETLAGATFTFMDSYNGGDMSVVGKLSAATYGSDGTVSDAELLYINSLSSNAQTQITANIDSLDAIGIIINANGDSLDASGLLISANADSLNALGVLVSANTPSLQSTTLGVGATTFASTSNIIILTGDGAANVLATITGANVGIYTVQFVDALITITDDDTHGADSIDLTGTDLTSADDLILQLLYDGISFYQISSSLN